MHSQQIETCIKNRDKAILYNYHMEKKISDKELLDAIIEIDNSIKSKRTNWLEVAHDILFPSAVKH